jgi:hypothetical protein
MEIWVANADGSNAHQITSGQANWARHICRIVNASFLLLTRIQRGFPFNLYTINEDGSGLSKISRDKASTHSRCFLPTVRNWSSVPIAIMEDEGYEYLLPTGSNNQNKHHDQELFKTAIRNLLSQQRLFLYSYHWAKSWTHGSHTDHIVRERRTELRSFPQDANLIYRVDRKLCGTMEMLITADTPAFPGPQVYRIDSRNQGFVRFQMVRQILK